MTHNNCLFPESKVNRVYFITPPPGGGWVCFRMETPDEKGEVKEGCSLSISQTHVQTRGEVIQPRASISVPPPNYGGGVIRQTVFE